ncbi:FAD-dependent monooxygenase [Pseudoalteromonas byunsanensis]|uniref:FAD-binding domain-containing protein n=1 Tax=Pseudoalteromonas byunsanensis TaxID=327939 RepID=A0A1S1N999_9GAMM|nr:FAD-dependent monooxygenase [Pseudoalteromonas byunsanensis]OHU96002.1 hypothetical protein BIW53_09380 [Pseudoalteromonas byunsanensis]
MTEFKSNDEVIIVGAGPVGLTSAIQLQRFGIKHRIIDKRLERQPFSKAFAIHSRSLEVFEDMGVLDDIRNKAHFVEGMHIYSNGKRLINYTFDVLDIPYQHVASIPQNVLEEILQQKYEQLGGTVEVGVELIDVKQQDNSVATIFKSADKQESGYFAYMIAADGIKSEVRTLLDIPFVGSDYKTPYIIADGKLDWHGDDKIGHVYVAGGGYIMFFPLPNGLWRVVVDESTNALTQEQLTPEVVNKYIRDKNIEHASFSDPVWLSIAHFKQRLIDNYNQNNIYFAGDACHVHSPIGGQGLNTGIQDAFNLSWKIAHSLLYGASPILLESYSRERRPVAQMVLDRTNQQMKLLNMANPVLRVLRDLVVPRIASTHKFKTNVVSQAAGFLVDYGDSQLTIANQASKLVGKRMPDCTLSDSLSGASERLFDLLTGTHYSLLLITNALSDDCDELLRSTPYLTGDFLKAFLISQKPASLEHQSSHSRQCYEHYVDSTGKLQRLTLLGEESALLVRPDGYVAIECSIQDAIKVFDYLGALYKKQTFEAQITSSDTPSFQQDAEPCV